MSKIVGISSSIIVNRTGPFLGYRNSSVHDNYIRVVSLVGGIPFVIPVVSSERIVEEQIRNIDVLILSGGYDVNPLIYGEEPMVKMGKILPERDTFDLKLIEFAEKYNKPVLAICRGIQIMTVYYGGTLYQDISYMKNSFIKHEQMEKASPEILTHTVFLEKRSFLYDIFNEDKILVNSFHHQAIKKVPDNFKVIAKAKDGVVEAIEKVDSKNFMVGVQWHPEMITDKNELMLEIFKKFIEKG